MAWSKYKDRVIAFVLDNPGCCKMDVARHVTYCALRSPNKQYYIVNTAIRHGWIEAVRIGGRYKLYVE